MAAAAPEPQIEFLYDWALEAYVRPFSDLTCLCGVVKEYEGEAGHQASLIHNCDPANGTVLEQCSDDADPRCSLGTCSTQGVCYKSFVVNDGFNKTLYR